MSQNSQTAMNDTSQSEIKFPVKSSSFKSGTEEASNVKKMFSHTSVLTMAGLKVDWILLGRIEPKSDETPRELTPRYEREALVSSSNLLSLSWILSPPKSWIETRLFFVERTYISSNNNKKKEINYFKNQNLLQENHNHLYEIHNRIAETNYNTI